MERGRTRRQLTWERRCGGALLDLDPKRRKRKKEKRLLMQFFREEAPGCVARTCRKKPTSGAPKLLISGAPWCATKLAPLVSVTCGTRLVHHW